MIAKKSTAKKRVPGIDEGKIWMEKDFGTLTKRELAVWYTSRKELYSVSAS